MEIIFLIGLSGTGKTTWRERFCRDNPSWVVISTDDFLEERVRESGIAYSEAFKTFYPRAAEAALAKLKEALANGRDIIIDRTNLVNRNPNPDPSYANQVNLERQAILDLVPKEYRRVAVMFEASAEAIEERRVRRQATGKQVPAEAITFMRSCYQPPTDAEFDLIVTPDQFALSHRPLPAFKPALRSET